MLFMLSLIGCWDSTHFVHGMLCCDMIQEERDPLQITNRIKALTERGGRAVRPEEEVRVRNQMSKMVVLLEYHEDDLLELQRKTVWNLLLKLRRGDDVVVGEEEGEDGVEEEEGRISALRMRAAVGAEIKSQRGMHHRAVRIQRA